MAKHREWRFTIFDRSFEEINKFNYKDIDDRIKGLASKNCEYCIIGKEVCPTTGRLHLQGYLKFWHPKTRSACQKWMMGFKWKCDCEVPRGTPQQNRDYCWKGEMKKATPTPHKTAIYWEVGKLPVGQGKRTDLDLTREILKNGGNMRIIVKQARSCQSIRMGEKYLTYHERKRTWKPIVYYCYGTTGTGKSRFASFYGGRNDDVYWCNETNKWWDGYDAHKVVIIDEMSDEFCTMKQFLRLTDRYEYRCEFKGGYRQLLAEVIIITTSKEPLELYKYVQDEKKDQLIRRLKHVMNFNKIHKERKKLNQEIKLHRSNCTEVGEGNIILPRRSTRISNTKTEGSSS